MHMQVCTYRYIYTQVHTRT